MCLPLIFEIENQVLFVLEHDQHHLLLLDGIRAVVLMLDIEQHVGPLHCVFGLLDDEEIGFSDMHEAF